MNELKSWVKVTDDQFRSIDPGYARRPFPEDFAQMGYKMTGPFIVEKTNESKKEIPFPLVMVNLRFMEDDRGNIVTMGSDFAVHEFVTKGRIQFVNGKIELRTKDWGFIKIRQITPEDASLLVAKFKTKNPSVKQIVDAFWPDDPEEDE
jgi:hypothetical protein